MSNEQKRYAIEAVDFSPRASNDHTWETNDLHEACQIVDREFDRLSTYGGYVNLWDRRGIVSRPTPLMNLVKQRPVQEQQ